MPSASCVSMNSRSNSSISTSRWSAASGSRAARSLRSLPAPALRAARGHGGGVHVGPGLVAMAACCAVILTTHVRIYCDTAAMLASRLLSILMLLQSRGRMSAPALARHARGLGAHRLPRRRQPERRRRAGVRRRAAATAATSCATAGARSSPASRRARRVRCSLPACRGRPRRWALARRRRRRI